MRPPDKRMLETPSYFYVCIIIIIISIADAHGEQLMSGKFRLTHII